MNQPNTDPNYLSDCHEAAVVVVGDSFGEGTNHYECTKCKQICDFHRAQPNTDNTLCQVADCTRQATREDFVDSGRYKIGVCDECYAEKHGRDNTQLDKMLTKFGKVLGLQDKHYIGCAQSLVGATTYAAVWLDCNCHVKEDLLRLRPIVELITSEIQAIADDLHKLADRPKGITRTDIHAFAKNLSERIGE